MSTNMIFRFFLFIVLSVAVVGAVTIITDEKVDSPTGFFETVDMFNRPLIFEDTFNNRLVAIFNGNSSFVTAQSQQLEPNITGSKVTFLGDVDNFDNVDGFSRFKEHNLNNGTNAASGFVAINDIGQEIRIGIGSSNFAPNGVNLSNQPEILSDSKKGFDFVNFLTDTIWRWRVGDDDDLSTLNTTTVMQLDHHGNLNITGNFTGNQFYAEMNFFDVLNPNIIVIDKILVVNSSGIFNFFNITNQSVGEINGFTFDDDALVAQVPGLYQVSFSISYQDQALGRHVIAISRNGVLQPRIASAAFISTANDIGSPSSQGFVRLEQGDRVNLVVGDRFAPATNIEVIVTSVNLIRIGD